MKRSLPLLLTTATLAAATFHGSIATGWDAVRARVRYSWRRGCPVGPVELRLLRVDHWGSTGGCTGGS